MADSVQKNAPIRDSETLEAAYDPGLEWLHCGRCHAYDHSITCPLGETPRPSGDTASTVFYVTNCAHVACETCMRQENGAAGSSARIDARKEHVCPVCGQRASIVELRTEVPEEVEKIFIPAVSHVEDALKVLKLQYGNAVRLLRYLKLKTSDYNRKYRDAVRALQKAQDEVKAQKHQMGLMKQEISTLKRLPGRHKSSPTHTSPKHPSSGQTRPTSARSTHSSPVSRSGRPAAIQTPNPPPRLSLRPNSKGSNNGSLSSSNMQQFQEGAAPMFQPDPMDVQYDQGMAYGSGMMQGGMDYPMDQPYYDGDPYSMGPDISGGNGFSQQQWASQPGPYMTDGPRTGRTTPIYRNQPYAPITPSQSPVGGRQFSTSGTLPPASLMSGSRPNTSSSGRPRTSMRQPFNRGGGDFSAATGFIQNPIGTTAYSSNPSRPVSSSGFADGRTLLTRNRSSFLPSAYM